MHFVNVEHTENKLYRHPVRVCTRNTHFIFYFFFLPLRPFKNFVSTLGQPYHNVFISESNRVSRRAPEPPSRRKYEIWFMKDPTATTAVLHTYRKNRITRTVYIQTAVAVSLDYEVLIKFSFLISVFRAVAISGISVL